MPAPSDSLLELLRCPACGGRVERGDGDVTCGQGHVFPVIREVPRMFEAASVAGEQGRTAAAFGYSWTHYPRDNPYTEEQWRDWIEPLGEGDFQGKVVLDAGCGLGGFAEYARRWGARVVVGVDLSEAIDAAHERLDGRVELVQGDIYRLPLAPAAFDVAYSIGVLHHLPDPESGFRSVAAAVRPGGLVFAWVYGRENNGWIVYGLDPLRKHLFSRLPRPLLKWGVALPLAAIVRAFVMLARRVSSLPYGEYLRWLGRREFGYTHGVVFDHLVAPVAHYVRRDEFEGWFRRAGLVEIRISWRNRNSWRGVGRVPE